MVYQEEQNTTFPSNGSTTPFDYSFVPHTARIAVYDDLKSAPRVIEIKPAPTNEFIEALASEINNQRLVLGGSIPYTIIREVSENFIHAQFSEIVVSIFDKGNTIRFCDQGPGIANKDQAVRPGFTSAIEPMKGYIRGVGSGLPIVKDYLDISDGTITIEDNMGNGTVVTISLVKEEDKPKVQALPMPPLSPRERAALMFFAQEGALGNKELADLLGAPESSTYNLLTSLEEYGLIEKSYKRKRILTDLGSAISQQL